VRTRFTSSFQSAPFSKDITLRVKNIIDNFTLLLLADVARSLFSKDKFLFISAAAFAILVQSGVITSSEVSALLGGQLMFSASAAAAKPDILSWLTDKMWADLVGVSAIIFDSSGNGAVAAQSSSTQASSSSSSAAAAAAAAATSAPRLTSASFLASFASNASDWQAWYYSRAAPITRHITLCVARHITHRIPITLPQQFSATNISSLHFVAQHALIYLL
jgi:hypothetical protein